MQRNTTVQAPTSDAGSDQEAAQKEVDRIVGVFLERLSRRCNTQEREAHNRQKCGDGNRNSFGNHQMAIQSTILTQARAAWLAVSHHLGTDVRFGQDEIRARASKGPRTRGNDLDLLSSAPISILDSCMFCLLKEGQLSG